MKNAEVVIHLVDIHGKQKAEGLELKTHDDGKAEATGIPYGKVRIQVIAPGFKTYGEDFSIDQPSLNSLSSCKNRPSSFPFTNDRGAILQIKPSEVKPRVQQQQGVYLLDITARECHF